MLLSEIQAYVDSGHITLDRALKLGWFQKQNLQDTHIRELIDAAAITVDQGVS